jgi:hypothetical protein
MTATKKPTTKKPTPPKPPTKKAPKAPGPVPWYQPLWVKLIGAITVLGAILTVLESSTSLFDRFYQPKPEEILVEDSPIRVVYNKNSSLSIDARIKYQLEAQTFLVDYIDHDSISITDYKIKNRRVINADSITNRSVWLYSKGGSLTEGNGVQDFHGLEFNLNVRLTLLPSVASTKPGKVFDIGYAVFSVPYFVEGVRKVKEQKVPLELVVK